MLMSWTETCGEQKTLKKSQSGIRYNEDIQKSKGDMRYEKSNDLSVSLLAAGRNTLPR